MENRGCFSAFTRIATVMRSNSRAPREMMSTCTLVGGSNDPGYTAKVDIVVSSPTEADGVRRSTMQNRLRSVVGYGPAYRPKPERRPAWHAPAPAGRPEQDTCRRPQSARRLVGRTADRAVRDQTTRRRDRRAPGQSCRG